mmetsp:Transcript_88495/g.245829  ORF Transcript_88495/g.245829 Transcript_88495/m.245829 type:complete len:264 (-) Transcript_88495:180-971(-)
MQQCPLRGHVQAAGDGEPGCRHLAAVPAHGAEDVHRLSEVRVQGIVEVPQAPQDLVREAFGAPGDERPPAADDGAANLGAAGTELARRAPAVLTAGEHEDQVPGIPPPGLAGTAAEEGEHLPAWTLLGPHGDRSNHVGMVELRDGRHNRGAAILQVTQILEHPGDECALTRVEKCLLAVEGLKGAQAVSMQHRFQLRQVAAADGLWCHPHDLRLYLLEGLGQRGPGALLEYDDGLAPPAAQLLCHIGEVAVFYHQAHDICLVP